MILPQNLSVSLLRMMALCAILLLTVPPSFAQDTGQDYRSARESDPQEMGWMQGFPPPDSVLLSASDRSFFQFPALRWSVVHMRQFLPTTGVSRGLGAPTKFDYALDAGIDSVTFTPWGSDEPMTWKESLWKNYTDGILILHDGEIVYEQYFAELTEAEKHAAMSVTKSFTGTLAAALVAEGVLDEEKEVTEYVPELEGSPFGDATVEQVMNMTTSLQYSENYADPDAEIWTYAEAGDPLPKPEDYEGPMGYYEYLPTLEKIEGRDHGDAFAYKTPNADVLGWVVARASGQSVAELLSERVWAQLGMEQSAYYQVDAKGTPSAGGGLSAGLRDLARFGEMIRNGGLWRGEQILPEAAIADIREGGSQEAFATSDHPELEGWSYKNMWWITHNDHDAFAARGVHGQTVYIDPAAEMVLVRFASHPVAANTANDPFSLPAYQAVAEYLMNRN